MEFETDPVKRVRILDAVDYAVVDYDSASDHIIASALRRKSYGVFAMPVHGIVLSTNKGILSEAVKQADLIVPDGHPVRWAMNYFYKTQLTDRVYGPLLTWHVLNKANKYKLKVFLYGGNTETTLSKFKAYIQNNFPDVDVCGAYREASPDGETLEPETVNSTGAQIVLIGRGCPKQELWIAKNKNKIQAVMMGVGAAFSFYAGTLEQAPAWMQDRGLEWFFRLIKEPRRLFKRYFVTNTTFILLVLKQIYELKVNPPMSPKSFSRRK